MLYYQSKIFLQECFLSRYLKKLYGLGCGKDLGCSFLSKFLLLFCRGQSKYFCLDFSSQIQRRMRSVFSFVRPLKRKRVKKVMSCLCSSCDPWFAQKQRKQCVRQGKRLAKVGMVVSQTLAKELRRVYKWGITAREFFKYPIFFVSNQIFRGCAG